MLEGRGIQHDGAATIVCFVSLQALGSNEQKSSATIQSWGGLVIETKTEWSRNNYSEEQLWPIW